MEPSGRGSQGTQGSGRMPLSVGKHGMKKKTSGRKEKTKQPSQIPRDEEPQVANTKIHERSVRVTFARTAFYFLVSLCSLGNTRLFRGNYTAWLLDSACHFWEAGNNRKAATLVEQAKSLNGGALPKSFKDLYQPIIKKVSESHYLNISNVGKPRPLPQSIVVYGKSGYGKSHLINALHMVGGNREDELVQESDKIVRDENDDVQTINWYGKKARVNTARPNMEMKTPFIEGKEHITQADEVLYLLNLINPRFDQGDVKSFRLLCSALVEKGKTHNGGPDLRNVRFVMSMPDAYAGVCPVGKDEGKWCSDKIDKYLAKINGYLSEHYPSVMPITSEQISIAGLNKGTKLQPDSGTVQWAHQLYQRPE